eukprot:GDKJ01015902.1.p1 GENE.GDKJ01015902.1~~GDKJ01015902.1.p1  ORF type:complete len:1159 (+),score=292.39 GDKJ01015902.1:41-3478(+)
MKWTSCLLTIFYFSLIFFFVYIFSVRDMDVQFTVGEGYAIFETIGISDSFVFRHVQQIDQVIFNDNFFGVDVDVVYTAYVHYLEDIPIIEQTSSPVEFVYVDGVSLSRFFIPARGSHQMSQTEEFITNESSLRSFLSRACLSDQSDIPVLINADMRFSSFKFGVPLGNLSFSSRVTIPCTTTQIKLNDDVDENSVTQLVDVLTFGLEKCLPYNIDLSGRSPTPPNLDGLETHLKAEVNYIVKEHQDFLSRCSEDEETEGKNSFAQRIIKQKALDPTCKTHSIVLDSFKSFCGSSLSLFDEAIGLRLDLEKIVTTILALKGVIENFIPALKLIPRQSFITSNVQNWRKVAIALEKLVDSDRKNLEETHQRLKFVTRQLEKLGGLYKSNFLGFLDSLDLELQDIPFRRPVFETSDAQKKTASAFVAEILKNEDENKSFVPPVFFPKPQTLVEYCPIVQNIIVQLRNEETALKRQIANGGEKSSNGKTLVDKVNKYKTLLYFLLRNPPLSPNMFPRPPQNKKNLRTPWRRMNQRNLVTFDLTKPGDVEDIQWDADSSWAHEQNKLPLYTRRGNDMSLIQFGAFHNRMMFKTGLIHYFPLCRRLLEAFQKDSVFFIPLPALPVDSVLLNTDTRDLSSSKKMDDPFSSKNQRAAELDFYNLIDSIVNQMRDLSTVSLSPGDHESSQEKGEEGKDPSSSSSSSFANILSQSRESVHERSNAAYSFTDKTTLSSFHRAGRFESILNSESVIHLYVYLVQTEEWLKIIADSIIKLSPFDISAILTPPGRAKPPIPPPEKTQNNAYFSDLDAAISKSEYSWNVLTENDKKHLENKVGHLHDIFVKISETYPSKEVASDPHHQLSQNANFPIDYFPSLTWTNLIRGVTDTFALSSVTVESIAVTQRWLTDRSKLEGWKGKHVEMRQCFNRVRKLTDAIDISLAHVTKRQGHRWSWLGSGGVGAGLSEDPTSNLSSLLESEMLGVGKGTSRGYLADSGGVKSEFALEWRVTLKGLMEEIVELVIKAFKLDDVSEKAFQSYLRRFGSINGTGNSVVDMFEIATCPSTIHSMRNLLIDLIKARMKKHFQESTEKENRNRSSSSVEGVFASTTKHLKDRINRFLDQRTRQELLIAEGNCKSVDDFCLKKSASKLWKKKD